MPLPRKDPNEVRRKVYFYQVEWARNPDTDLPLEFVARDRLKPLEGLSFDDESAYLTADDQVTCGWLDSHVRLRVADIRRTNLPALERLGQLSPLQIDTRDGLAEQVHVRFFQNNIVGSEFNFYGPRISRVARYLASKAGMPAITFRPLVRKDTVAELDKLEDIRMFEMRIRPSYIDEVSGVDSGVGGMFRAARSVGGDTGRISVILSPEPHSGHRLPGHLKSVVRALAGRPDIREIADVLKTSGRSEDDGRVRTIDLLRDSLALEMPMRRLDGTRSLEADSVYGGIEEAYSRLRKDLEAAAGLEAAP